MKRWSKEEDAFLKNNYIQRTDNRLAEVLGRTIGSVRRRLKKLRLKKLEQKVKDFIGKVFGNLTVIDTAKRLNGKTRYWCQCACGRKKIVNYDSLVYGNSTTCGCLKHKNLERTQYRAMYKMYKYSAKKRKIAFKLTFKEFVKLTSYACHYCGVSPERKPIKSVKNKNIDLENRGIVVNGIDRKDNKIGYVLSNCVPCCPSCNYMKQDMHIDQFLRKIVQIYENLPEEY
jgi:hypothetical protein